MRRLTLIATLSVAIIVALFAAPAYAGTTCPPGTTPGTSPDGGVICIPVVDGGGPCDYDYVSPQPPAGDPLWEGTSPDDGDLYMKVCPGPGTPTYVVRPNAAPDPADLARRALGQMPLARPDIHLAPKPPAKTYVGLATWLWMPPGQWSTLRKSVTAGDTTVTVVAVPQSVAWDMGPATKTCYSAGREWKVGKMPKGSKTSCSYTYKQISDFQPDKKFKIAATITYKADWTCEGDCLADDGTLGQVPGPTGGAAIRVSERQSVVVGGKN